MHTISCSLVYVMRTYDEDSHVLFQAPDVLESVNSSQPCERERSHLRMGYVLGLPRDEVRLSDGVLCERTVASLRTEAPSTSRQCSISNVAGRDSHYSCLWTRSLDQV